MGAPDVCRSRPAAQGGAPPRKGGNRFVSIPRCESDIDECAVDGASGERREDSSTASLHHPHASHPTLAQVVSAHQQDAQATKCRPRLYANTQAEASPSFCCRFSRISPSPERCCSVSSSRGCNFPAPFPHPPPISKHPPPHDALYWGQLNPVHRHKARWRPDTLGLDWNRCTDALRGCSPDSIRRWVCAVCKQRLPNVQPRGGGRARARFNGDEQHYTRCRDAPEREEW